MPSIVLPNVDTSFSGAMFIDKPAGITSAEVLRILKREVGIKKLGHAGTLDPLATGLLIVLCGKASRLQDMFLNSDKEYEATILLGQGTDTDDTDGSVIFSEDIDLGNAFGETSALEEKLCQTFVGEISQVPPKFSAIKQNGRPLYERARRGEEIHVEARSVCIHSSSFKVVSKNSVFCRVACSKGTYIRSIARDAGELLGTAGCISALRRIRSGCFEVANAMTLEELRGGEVKDGAIVPMEQLSKQFSSVVVDSEAGIRLQGGDQRPLFDISADNASADMPYAALWNEQEALLGFLELNSTDSQPNWKIRFML